MPLFIPQKGSGLYSYAKRFNGALNIVCVGDSLTEGFPGENGGYPVRLGTLRPNDTVTNSGTTGITTATLQTQISSDVTPFKSATKTNIVIFFEGTNDIDASGLTAAQVMTGYATYISTVKNLGWHVITATILPAVFDANFNTQSAAANALLRANHQGAEMCVDNAADSFFVPTDTNVYDGDQIHLNNNGYQHLAANFHAALTKYVG